MQFQRKLDLKSLISSKSLFLLGPRATGKSSLLSQTWPSGAFTINLLASRQFRALSADPGLLEEQIRNHQKKYPSTKLTVVIIDEIQKLPELLDEVHRLIEADKSLRFVLTGSSAHKLRKAGVNLLGGRARMVHFHPICFPELAGQSTETPVTYESLMQWGGLPSVLTSSTPREDLEAYLDLYLKEEIQAEAVTRSIGDFSRFLQVAALTNGEQVIFASVASDAQLKARTVQGYYQILEDTLIGKLLPAYTKTAKRKAMASSKFYFFDVGIANALLGRWHLKTATPNYGRALEHRVFCELSAAIAYGHRDAKLYYWRSLSKLEVDFVVERGDGEYVGIEVKGTGRVSKKDLHGLAALAEDLPGMRKIVVSLEETSRITENGIEIMTMQEFLEELWKVNVPGLLGKAS
jgi:predicted AAA+ superfamily ATPase